jgi:LacI family transcriptional regulator
MKTTIREVAQAAGVSAMAVSSVLHGTGRNVRVSQDTAEKIRRIAADLRYQPNNVARSLRSRQTNMVGVVFQHFGRLSDSNPYYPLLLNGVMSALFPQKYTLALCPDLVQGGSEQALFDGRFDGILWARPDFAETSIDNLKNSRIPIVFMHAPPGSVEGMPTFCADNDGALRLVVRHLKELGHKDICFVIDELNEHTAEGRARTSAFLAAVKHEGLWGEIFVWDENPRSFKKYLADNPKLTAMSCFSDTLAGTLLQTCKILDIQVPWDLSVVGFDSSTFCERTSPRLTSVHQPVELIAFEAVSHLLSLIKEQLNHKESTASVSSTYKCGLDLRDSTAVAPKQQKV